MEIGDRDNAGGERLMSGGTTNDVGAISSSWESLDSRAQRWRGESFAFLFEKCFGSGVTQCYAVILDSQWQPRETSGAFGRFRESVNDEGRGDCPARWVASVSRDVSY